MGRVRAEHRYSEERQKHGYRDGRDIGSERANENLMGDEREKGIRIRIDLFGLITDPGDLC